MANIFRRGGDKQELAITISTGTFAKLSLLIIATIILLATLKRAEHALVLIFISAFLALALNAPVAWLSNRLPGKLRGRRGLATALSTVIVVLALAAFTASLVPPIARQTSTLVDRAPELVRNLRSSDSQVGQFITKYRLQNELDQISSQLSARIQRSGGTAVSTLGAVSSSFFSVLTIIVMTFMMIVEGPRWLEFFRELLPARRRKHVDQMSTDMYRVIRGYVNGQVLLAAIAACLVLPGLLIFHVSYPVALMAVVFICGLIPMVGHTLGAILVSLVALFHSPLSAVGILIYYITYQQVENYLIQPRLQASATDMSPLLVFVSLVVGINIGGLLGGLVAIPIAGCIRVFMLDYLRARDLIEDKNE